MWQPRQASGCSRPAPLARSVQNARARHAQRSINKFEVERKLTFGRQVQLTAAGRRRSRRPGAPAVRDVVDTSSGTVTLVIGFLGLKQVALCGLHVDAVLFQSDTSSQHIAVRPSLRVCTPPGGVRDTRHPCNSAFRHSVSSPRARDALLDHRCRDMDIINHGPELSDHGSCKMHMPRCRQHCRR